MRSHKNLISLLYISSVLISLDSCSSQKEVLNLSGFSKAQMKYDDSEAAKSPVGKLRVIEQLSFFEIFDDSVVVYLSNKRIWNRSLYKKNNPFTSTGWSGYDLDFVLKQPESLVTIQLINQKEYIQFKVSKGYSKYVIQRYGGIWYVRALNHDIKLK